MGIWQELLEQSKTTLEDIIIQAQSTLLKINAEFDEIKALGNSKSKIIMSAIKPINADCQLNNATQTILSPNNTKKKENVSMPKIRNIYVYKRKDGYYQSVFAKDGVHKSFSAKYRADVVKKAKEYKEQFELSHGCADDVTKFGNLANVWLNTIKRPYVSAVYYRGIMNLYKLHVAPTFENRSVKSIRPMDLQPYFAELSEKSSRNAETIKTILSGIFEYAIGNGIITTNPMRAVIVERHERKNGRALTRDELEKFKRDIEGKPTYKLPFLIFLYTGVRRAEFQSLEFDFESGFVKVKNAKLKRYQKNLYRELPILPALRRLRSDIEADGWRRAYVDEVAKTFAKLVPGGRLNWLRHTFQSYCRLTASPEMVNEWAGHTLGKNTTDRIYLHFQREDELKISDKIDY